MSIAELMGLEGAGAAAYFAALQTVITSANLRFHGRNRRPPQDPINAPVEPNGCPDRDLG